MEIRVKDFLCFDYFKSLRLLAGEGGLSKPVSGCGVLDYELDQSFNEKYIHSNFLPGQLVLTSALFAKDNPFLLRDAVKYLVNRACSGLVIKNVFRLPIHDSILRYADSKDFPVFLMDDPHMYFEDFIIQIDRCIQIIKHSELAEAELGRLLYQPLDRSEKKDAARRLFPFFRDQYLVIYVQLGQTLTDDALLRLTAQQKEHIASQASSALLRYQKGFFLFLSQDVLSPALAASCIQALLPLFPESFIGVSDVHFQVEDTGNALQEALYAAQIHQLKRQNPILEPASYQNYAELGIYQVLLPVLDHESFPRYARRILEPLLEFDAENRGNLTRTLLDFVQCGGDLRVLAQYTGQHENTLRYRLDKIAGITGLSYKKLADYEQLALAVRIYLLLQNQNN